MFKELFESKTGWVVTKDDYVYSPDGAKIQLSAVLKGVKRSRIDYEAYVWDTENDARFILNQVKKTTKINGLSIKQIPVR